VTPRLSGPFASSDAGTALDTIQTMGLATSLEANGILQ
jgi:hypothetical protein